MDRSLAPTRVVEEIVGTYEEFCDASPTSDPGSREYVTVLKLSTSTTADNMDSSLEEIVSMNRAAAEDAYTGQINSTSSTTSSWLSGLIWGYDIARHESLDDGSLRPMMKRQRRDGVWIPVYSASPLLAAGESLFGTSVAKRFPLVPGSNVLCAMKDVVARGPIEVWSAVALAIAEDRRENASLFIEDAGHGIEGESRHAQEGLLHGFHRLNDLVDAVILCGDDQGVNFKEIFIGYKSQWVSEGQVGCAMSCVPYLALAKGAVPQPASELLGMSLSDWEAFAAPVLGARGADE